MEIWTIWLIIAGFFAFLEMLTVGFFVIWLGIAAIPAMIYSMFFPEQVLVQVIIWVILSIILIISTKKLTDKVSPPLVPTNVYSIIGKQAVVTKEINDEKSQGQIRVGGDVWSARGEKITDIIPENTVVVEILRIEGVKAIVRASNTDDSAKNN